MFSKREVLDFSRAAELRAAMTKWEFFVLRHRQPANLAVHFLCTCLYFGGLAALAVTRDWRCLLGPALSSLIGSPAHYLFDDGEVDPRHGEGIFTGYVPFFLLRVYFELARGTYFDEVERVEERYRQVMEELAAAEGA